MTLIEKGTEDLRHFFAFLDLELVEKHPVGHCNTLVFKDYEASSYHVEFALLLAICYKLFQSVEGTASKIVCGFEDLSGWVALGTLLADQLMLQAKTSE